MFLRQSTLRIVGVRGPENIHSLSPVLTKNPDSLDQEEISNWVGNFINNNRDEIELQYGLCTLPASASGYSSAGFDLEDSWLQTIGAFFASTGSATTNIISTIINFFFTVFFLLVFLLIMCVMSG